MGLDWHACDFFGRDSDPALRRLIFRVADTDEQQGLAQRLDRLLGRTLHGDFDSFRRAVKGRQHQARRLIERLLTMDINHHGVVEPLAEMIEAWLELRDLNDTAGQWRRRHLLLTARVLLERLLGEIARAWSLAGVADRLDRDRDKNAAILRAAAYEVGLTETPRGLFRVTRSQVHGAS